MIYADFLLIGGFFVILIHTSTQKKVATIRQSSWEAYGGVLNEFSGSLLPNDTDIQDAAEFAIKFARKRHPQKFPQEPDGSISQYTIRLARKLKLVHTGDGRHPYMVQLMDPDTTQPMSVPLVWGVTYWFQILWPTKPRSVIHSFCVTQYWDNKLFMFEHTFFPNTNIVSETADALREETVKKEMLQRAGVSLSVASESEKSPSLDAVQSHTLKHLEEADSSDETSSKTCTQSGCDGTNVQSLASESATSKECDTDEDSASEKYMAESQGKFDDELMYAETEDEGLKQDLSDKTNETPVNNGKTTASSEPTLHQNVGSLKGVNRGASRELRLVCYNVWNVNGEGGDTYGYPDRLQRMAKLLQSSKADIFALQEVRFEDGAGEHLGPNQVEHFATYLPDYQFVYQPAQIQSHKLPSRSDEGVAIFSKFPITDRGYILLPRNDSDIADTHQRILLHAEIKIPQIGPVHVFTTHLSLSHAARQISVQYIWRHLAHYTGPLFLMGDFNAEKHNEEVGFLSGRVALKGTTTTGLKDIWAYKYGLEDDGFTYNTQESSLSKRIDFIFMRDEAGVGLRHVWLLDDGERGLHAASDHLGIAAQFVIKQPGPE